MATFNKAIKKVLMNEGGVSDDSKDLGGTTNYGISLRFLKTIQPDATKETIKSLTQEQAENIYFQHFWLSNHYDEITSQQIAEKVFDTAVNMGSLSANRFLQETLNIVIFNGVKLDEDGIIGTQTLNAINLLDGEDVDGNILKVYSLLQKEYYFKIILNRPEQMRFAKGWNARADR